MAIYQLGDLVPDVHPSAYVAESATVIGRVKLEANTTVWSNVTIRGDNDQITIGENSNIQESAVLHTDPGFLLTLGRGVTVGHQVMLHGCTVGDGSLIGIQAVVLNGARIGRRCIVAAGAVVTEGKEFPDASLILGAPARVVKALTPQQLEGLAHNAAHYVENARRYRGELKRIT
jgi:carbonic anhydrase/acetyltransferase-like protein (isoleucine patch superfamily)